MVHDRTYWRIEIRRAAPAVIAALLSFACCSGAAVHAQSIMRSPNLNIESRMPSINPTTRIDPNLSIRRDPDRSGPGSGVGADGGGGGGNPTSRNKTSKKDGPRRGDQPAGPDLRIIAGELVAEIDGARSEAQIDELARHHGLARIGSQHFPLIDATIGLFRITDRRSVATVSRELAADVNFHSVQPNFRYVLQDQKAAPTEGDPAQYALAKLRLPEAHMLAHGANVIVAVIDSGIDAGHPELANTILDSFDALGSKEGPHLHGTAVAGAIVAHARLMGSAPAARILAIRAFGAGANGVESNSFVILKSLDYAAAHGAQILNMSFAGSKDGLIERGIAATAARGIVMVAASGNAGPKSPPLFPAANANVIAVGATDAQDRLFPASNRGGYIALVAPGADIFLPVPGEKYQMLSGTSFSAAYVSGVAALMLERNPALKPDQLRAILAKTARDLGAPGRDDLFGAGEADAYAAVSAVIASPAVPVAGVSDKPAAEKASVPQDVVVTRGLNPPTAAMASDKSAGGQTSEPAAR
jgi:subtilisin family serine protease